MAETTGEREAAWQQYERTVTMGELRPYVPGEDLTHITVNPDDVAKYGCPKEGDMVARDPKDRDNQWLVSKEYFEHTYKSEPMQAQPFVEPPAPTIEEKRLGPQVKVPDILQGAKRSEF